MPERALTSFTVLSDAYHYFVGQPGQTSQSRSRKEYLIPTDIL